MPPKSERQRKFMGAELSRKRAGKKTETGMSETQLEDFATKPKGKKLPAVAKKKKKPIKRQAGGPVMPGNNYMVGESGPEMFQPKTSGKIVPTRQLMMGQAPPPKSKPRKRIRRLKKA